jgi:hypothetical protein
MIIFGLLIIHDYNRTSFITRVLHATTWDYFTSELHHRFFFSGKVVKEAIMADINDFVQEFSKISSDIWASFFAMSHLFEILERCFPVLNVCFDIISVLRLPSTQLINNLQIGASAAHSDIDETAEFISKFQVKIDGYRKMFDQSISKDLGVVLRFLPGVVVQKRMSMQGMADLYRIKPDFVERLIKSSILIDFQPGRVIPGPSCYILDDYLSRYLQDRDRSQHYYCDPMLQHISICRQILSSLDESNSTFAHQS